MEIRTGVVVVGGFFGGGGGRELNLIRVLALG